MFQVRNLQHADLPAVHSFTIKLVQHHLNQGNNTHLKLDQYTKLFEDGLFDGLVLSRHHEQSSTGTNGEDIIGCLIFFIEFSVNRGNKGILIDQFFIEEKYRGQKLGRKLVQTLSCIAQKTDMDYLKVVYQDGLGLDKVYQRMGFNNETKLNNGLHLFESYGPSQLQKCLQFFEDYVKREGETSVVTQRDEGSTITVAGRVVKTVPFWMDHSDQFNFNSASGKLPRPHLVFVMDKAEPTQSVVSNCDGIPVGQRMCLMLEQQVFCSWLGPMLYFSGFLGDISLVSPELLSWRLSVLSKQWHGILGAIWEVPVGVQNTNKEIATTKSDGAESPIAEAIDKLNEGVSDDTAREGWNIAYMNRKCIEKLALEQIKDYVNSVAIDFFTRPNRKSLKKVRNHA